MKSDRPKSMLEFYNGVVTTANLQQTESFGLRGYGFIRPDAGGDRIWFGSSTTNGTKLEKGDRVKFALASSPSKSGRLAASIVRLDETIIPSTPAPITRVVTAAEREQSLVGISHRPRIDATAVPTTDDDDDQEDTTGYPAKKKRKPNCPQSHH